MALMSDLLARLRARSPVVPRSSRDAVEAECAELRSAFDAVGLGDAQTRHWLAHFQDAQVAPFLTFAPPGHFYSPIPPLDEAVAHVTAVFDEPAQTIPGIDLRLDDQLALAEELAPFHADFDPPADRTDGRRYHTDNPAYGFGDAAIFQALLRHRPPKRIIEVGSGYSSALLLDVIDDHLDASTEVTFIEPFDELLMSVLRPEDLDRVTIVDQGVQQVDLARFEELEADDVLFIDSTHVVRAGSDVLTDVFDVLPRLAPGVVVHFHDMFHPFEYPAAWIREGRVWTEAYLLRAFLQYNDAFEIMLFPHQLRVLAFDRLRAAWPAIDRGTGASLWLRRKG
jgi:predicted O-methyltransferase YrrM